MTQIEDFADLSRVTIDKLYKLRDVATDNCIEIRKEYQEAQSRLADIQMEIARRSSQLGID